MEMTESVRVTENDLPNAPGYESEGIGKYRLWFRETVDKSRDRQDAAREDYEFVGGKHRSEADVLRFNEQGRPAITINRIKPLINVLSGYQRLNRYDIEFLVRTPDDVELAQVRKGITKYVLDRCAYDTNESAMFVDAAISGVGWFFVGYKYDDETGDARRMFNGKTLSEFTLTRKRIKRIFRTRNIFSVPSGLTKRN